MHFIKRIALYLAAPSLKLKYDPVPPEEVARAGADQEEGPSETTEDDHRFSNAVPAGLVPVFQRGAARDHGRSLSGLQATATETLLLQVPVVVSSSSISASSSTRHV